MNNKDFNMQKKFFVNALTLSRIPISIMFNIALFYGKYRLLICSILFLIIALTDFFDGKLARYYNVESKMGAILDIGADFFFVFTASCFLYEQNLLPLGIIAIIVIKFAEFCFTSYLLNKERNDYNVVFFDGIGRFVAIVLYIIPLTVIILQSLVHKILLDNVLFSLCIAIGLLSLFSFCMRILKIIQYKIEI